MDKGYPAGTRGTDPKQGKEAMYKVLDTCGGKDGMDSGAPRYGGRQQGDEQWLTWKINIVNVGTQTRRRGRGITP